MRRSRFPSQYVAKLARIAQEAGNVRKAQRRETRPVQLLKDYGRWELLWDDGIGFAFSGRCSQSELDSMGCAPAIIRERVD